MKGSGMEKEHMTGLDIFFTVSLVFIYLAGLAGFLFIERFSGWTFLTPLVLFVTGLYAFYPMIRERNRRFAVWFGITAVITFFLEVLGAATGWVFGHYSYGQGLGFRLLGVPPVIGWNWVLVVFGAREISRRLIRDKLWLMALVTAFICVAFDFIMEPAAVRMDFWTWDSGRIPLQNYLAWGIISFAAAFFYPGRQEKDVPLRRFPVIFIITQTVFFSVLNFIHSAGL
jgi:putative membrane protein